ncbi:ABC-three component system protein [Flavisolibacter tropicus]|uniref:ABC-three component systems C-terminal domain-containing protein n=1 Tax=Flavisolibacter tropicus TaxID=1492898 RepID=A0A172TUE7_9BACT|nr:ABC-three component system protein [Flavisolibacter tropicus]ANE50622.1 hypothetical protein SY85_09030 [Flavisolibacter tropicus]
MINNDTLAHFTVMVNNGSGCLFNGATTDYLYVLTCKHNLISNQTVQVAAHYLDDHGHLVEVALEVIEQPFIHKDPNKDAAIIKVKFAEKGLQLLIINDPVSFSKTLKLAGYPEVRSDKTYQLRLNDIEVVQTGEHGYIEAVVGGNANYDEIVGQSGGGIFFIEGERIFLIGIQSRMAAKNEQLSRVEFMPIKFFEEIISDNSVHLKELLPHYLYSFSFLKTQVMKLEGCFIEQNVAFTRDYLRAIGEEIIQSPLTPLLIKNAFKERLVVHNQALYCLSEKGIWIAWLEFLIVMRIMMDKKITDINLEEIFNSYRLIFSGTDGDWAQEMPSIMRSDYKGLKKGGKVIVSTNRKPIKPFIPEGMVTDLVRDNRVQSGELKIDDGIGHPLKAYKLYHLHAFQAICIIGKETDYKNFSTLTEDELFKTLQTEFNGLLQQHP